MAIIGTLLAGAVGGFGKKPVIPGVESVEPGKVQQQTIADNARALPAAQDLAAKTNKFNTQQMRAMFESVLGSNLGVAEELIGSQLRGIVPGDVQRQIQDSAAARSLALGGGGGLAKNLTLRDLGLTSMQTQQQGLAGLFQFGNMLRAPLMDPSTMFYSPQQRLAFEVNERDTRFNRNLLANQVAAMPNPFNQALGQAFIQEEAQLGELLGTVGGIAAQSYASGGGG